MIYTRRTRLLKKKIISLVFGMFMAVFSVFSLAGCSLISTDNTKKNQKTVLKMGDTELSRSDILSSFYTYYQNNSNYFSYYDSATIEESFYTWAIIKEVINQKSAEAIYNAETNPDGYIVYSKENDKKVWKNTYDYIYNQINSYEKSVYASEGYIAEQYPVWLTEKQAETEPTKFEAYEKIDPEGVCQDKSQAATKATEKEILDRIADEETNLKKYLFEYVVETDEDGNETRKAISETIEEEQKFVEETGKDKFIEIARSQAYVNYIEGLVNTAKSAGKEIDEQKLFNDEVVKVYEAYYESEISTLLQTYYLNDYLLDAEGDTPLTDKAIAEAFLNDYYSDYQTYQFEDAYITTMTNKDGASLVLYHYDGQNYFFTVQHILVKNDEHLTEQIKEIPGYDSTGKNDYDAEGDNSIAKQFLAERERITNDYFMASVVNKDNIKDSISLENTSTHAKFADYYYYDEEKTSTNSGYIKVVKVEEGEEESKTVKYYVADSSAKGYDETQEIEESKVLYLASDENIADCYKYNYAKWVALATEYAGYITASNQAKIDEMREANADLVYVFDTVENMVKAGKEQVEINQKISSYLFLELEWLFSSDSLGNKLSNKMGYVMSNYPDEHGSWVSEFSDGARALINNLKEGGYDTVQEGIEAILKGEVQVSDGQSGTRTKDVNDLTIKIISTYGYHIIKVENVYESGSSLIDVDAIKTALGAEKINVDTAAHVEAIVEAMKETYVCTASNQTVYDYYFDELYTGFVGSSWLGDTSQNATSGTYFLKLEYEWLHELYRTGQIEFIEKIPYDELMKTVK